MKLLVSARDISEARTCLNACVDLLDIKNPAEGSLGANFPWLIQEVRSLMNDPDMALSATIGDCPFKPGTVSMAALGCAFAGAGYIKAGLYGAQSVDEATQLMRAVVRAVKGFNPKALVIAAAYADYQRIKAIDPMSTISAAVNAGCDVVMVDTAIKDGTTLFDHLDVNYLLKFVGGAKSRSLQVALAGSIQREHLADLVQIGPDIVGVRGAVCENGDRNGGAISARLIGEFREHLLEVANANVCV